MNQIDLIAENQRLKAKTQALEEAIEQFMWERDVAIEQLESYDVGFAEKADVVKVVHGKWIPVEAPGIGNTAKCSECGKRQYGYDEFNFCPVCGARMDLEE